MHTKYIAAFLLLIFGVTLADEENGWFKLGESLAGGAQADRDAAYLEGLQLGAEIRARQVEQKLLEAEAEYQKQTQRIQRGLQQNWRYLGLSPEDAHAVAISYSSSPDEAAIFRFVRQKSNEQIVGDIRRALEEYDFLLANQLLLGWILKHHDSENSTE